MRTAVLTLALLLPACSSDAPPERPKRTTQQATQVARATTPAPARPTTDAGQADRLRVEREALAARERQRQQAAAEQERQRKAEDRRQEEASRKEEAAARDRKVRREISLIEGSQEREITLALYERLKAGKFNFDELTGAEWVMLKRNLSLLFMPELEEVALRRAYSLPDFMLFVGNLKLRGSAEEKGILLRLTFLNVLEVMEVVRASEQIKAVGGLKRIDKVDEQTKGVIRRFPDLFPDR